MAKIIGIILLVMSVSFAFACDRLPGDSGSPESSESGSESSGSKK